MFVYILYAWVPFLDIKQCAFSINWVPFRQVYTRNTQDTLKTKSNLIIQTTLGCSEGRY